MDISKIYGADDLESPRAIREYLQRVRRASRIAATEIGDCAEQLETIISASPGVGILLGWDTRRRARHICEPLNEAANATNVAAKLAVVTWKRFEDVYGETLEQASGKKRGKQINWSQQ